MKVSLQNCAHCVLPKNCDTSCGEQASSNDSHFCSRPSFGTAERQQTFALDLMWSKIINWVFICMESCHAHDLYCLAPASHRK